MVVSGALAIFLVGCIGGVIAEIGRWYELRTSPGMPAYAREIKYWVITLLMIAAGGFLAIGYGTEPKNAILIANIGLSAPLIIKGLAALKPPTPPTGFAPRSGARLGSRFSRWQIEADATRWRCIRNASKMGGRAHAEKAQAYIFQNAEQR